ncbi:hypothetical protein [Pseudomonas umsongensis]|jgi:single-stranded DNA-specific DHH superfamily exonuclease|uniref:hypothetical protein n=1 Tax=Pseudomonas umsongensis TaxID=198618 RepID=UPI00037DED94|nr:hypothetical protein [Pseudomonas umsongensis]
MTTQNETIADVLELIAFNQIALRAGIEELAKWVLERGSKDIHTNVLTALQTLDTNAEGITSVICLLRQE